VTDWPEHLDACANCTGLASAYSYGARGYCSRCYRVIRHIEEVEAWDRKRPETLKRIAKDGMFDPAVGYRQSTRLITDGFNETEFTRFQKRIIRQLKRRLGLLHHREEIRRGEVPVSALMLEHKFAELLHLVRTKADYPRNASYLNRHFNQAERRILYALLEEIIEQAPWRGIDWGPVFDRLRDA
jgi:hypothetical protein